MSFDPNTLSIEFKDTPSEAGVISHVPWTLQFLNHLPKGQAFRFLKNLGADIVRQRIQKGSTRRDLFHYLVNFKEDYFGITYSETDVCDRWMKTGLKFILRQ